MGVLKMVFLLVRSLLISRAALAAENLAIRQQLAVLNEHPNGFTVSELSLTAAVDVLVEDASDAELFQEELNQGMGTEPVDLENLSPCTCTLQETPHTGGRSRPPFCCHSGLFYSIAESFQPSRSSSNNPNIHKRL